jgi:UDP-N-acetyl-D-mannosaminuronate dehydrogenase
VGLPLAMRAVAAEHEVTGYDTDPVRVKRLEAGESYVEDVPPAELAAALGSGRFRPSARAGACAGFDATTDEIAAADAVVLLTDHDAFADSGIGRHARYVLDDRRALPGPNVKTL